MRSILATALALVALGCASPSRALAQGSVQGVAHVGSPVSPSPVAVGAKDGSGNVQYFVVDPAGNLLVSIATVNTTTGTPSALSLLLDPSRALYVQPGVNPALDHPTFTGETSSSGTSAVTIAPAVSGKVNYLTSFTAENTSTTTVHTVKVKDAVSGKVIFRATLGIASAGVPGGQALLDGAANQGCYQSGAGSALVLVLGDAGTTDVTFTAGYVAK